MKEIMAQEHPVRETIGARVKDELTNEVQKVRDSVFDLLSKLEPVCADSPIETSKPKEEPEYVPAYFTDIRDAIYSLGELVTRVHTCINNLEL